MNTSILMRLLVVVTLLLPGHALAGSLSVAPLRIFLDARTKLAQLTVINQAEEKVTVQVKGVAWSIDAEGKERYQPTKEILYFPRIFTLEPKGQQLIRIGYRGATSIAREKTYRLFVEELPVATPGGETALKFAIRFGVPIFVQPSDDVKSWKIENMTLVDGQARVEVSNAGSRHVSVRTIVATGLSESGEELFSQQARGWYVLAGNTTPFFVPLPNGQCLRTRELRVKVTIGGQDSKEKGFKVRPAPALCTPKSAKTQDGSRQN